MKSNIRIFILGKKAFFLSCAGLTLCLAVLFLAVNSCSGKKGEAAGEYVILAANDLGMHCYQKSYSGFLILPPGNNLKVQIFKNKGGTAELITSGVTVSYRIIDNTGSSQKINFWDYAADYGYDVPPDIGITGNGLEGTFKLSSDGRYYEATAIPVTPFNDGSVALNPYQMAKITVTDKKSGKILAETDDIVVPVSNEMDCGICHGEERTDLNILEAHDELSNTDLARQLLLENKRYKCSDCHRDNILEQAGKPGVLPLSQAMHGFHADKMYMSDVTPKCYSCHPGPVTQCNRGRMYIAGVDCDNPRCHGNTANIAQTQAEGRQAWLQEPDCGACHGEAYEVNPNALYRNSYLVNSPYKDMNGIILCESCHNGTHAEWTSSRLADNLLPISLQGFAGYISECSVCHEARGKIIHKHAQ